MRRQGFELSVCMNSGLCYAASGDQDAADYNHRLLLLLGTEVGAEYPQETRAVHSTHGQRVLYHGSLDTSFKHPIL